MQNNEGLQHAILGQDPAHSFANPLAPLWLQFIQSHRVELVSIFACMGLIGLVFELVRRHQVKEKYSFLWFLTGFSLLVLSLRRDWLTKLSSLLGIYYPPTALFLVLSFFTIVILVHYSMVLTSLLSQNQKLAQKLALLEAELSDHKSEVHKIDVQNSD